MCLVETVEPAGIFLRARIQLTRQRDSAVRTFPDAASAMLETEEQMMLDTGRQRPMHPNAIVITEEEISEIGALRNHVVPDIHYRRRIVDAGLRRLVSRP